MTLHVTRANLVTAGSAHGCPFAWGRGEGVAGAVRGGETPSARGWAAAAASPGTVATARDGELSAGERHVTDPALARVLAPPLPRQCATLAGDSSTAFGHRPSVDQRRRRAEDRRIKRAFGRHLAALRRAKGLTQEGLAHKAELDRTYVNRVEQGDRNPSLCNLVRLAWGLEVRPAKLLDLDFSQSPEPSPQQRPRR